MERLYDLCIDDYEKYELYWKTLKEAILYTYKDSNVFKDENGNFNEQLFDDFIYNYIPPPPEFIRKILNYFTINLISIKQLCHNGFQMIILK